MSEYDVTQQNIPDTSVLVGANCDIYIDNVKIGFMDEINIDENYNVKEIRAIGFWFARDAKSMMFAGSLTGKLHLLTNKNEVGKANLVKIQNILTQKGHLFEFRERSTGKIIMKAICKLNSEKSNVSSNSISSRNVNFMIIRIQHFEGYN